MSSLGFFTGRSIALIGFGLLVTGVPDAAYAQKSDHAKQGAWGSVCVTNKNAKKGKKGKILGCRLVQRILLQSGKKGKEKKGLLLAVQMRRPKNGKPYIHLHLPLGLSLPAGWRLRFSMQKPKSRK